MLNERQKMTDYYCRSRFAVFVNNVQRNGWKRRHRCIEPSRLPVRRLQKALKKRARRKFVRKYISKSVPRTSVIYEVVCMCIKWKMMLLGMLKGIKRCSCDWLTLKKLGYKNVNHRMRHVSVKLLSDIETNPGPYVVDALKSISAPFCQGDTTVFGANAGSQCVAMSLTAVLYNWTHGIRSSSDLVEIMNIGNELYTHLSRSARQNYLLLSELPEILCLGEDTYKLKYSESYYGNIFHADEYTIVESNCVPLRRAFELLVDENYVSFMLTVTILTVAIFKITDGAYKVFDSHSRNLEGMNDVLGTCVSIELDSLDHLLEYFETMYAGRNDALFEVKGVEILTNEIAMNVYEGGTNSLASLSTGFVETMPQQGRDICCCCKNCCFVCVYAICFSVIKGTRYWDEETLESLIENGNEAYERVKKDRHSMLCDVANGVTISGATLTVGLNKMHEGIVQTEAPSLIEDIKVIVEENQENNTGFLVIMSSSYHFACIFRRESLGKISYCFFGIDDRSEKGYFYETIEDKRKAMKYVCTVMADRAQMEAVPYKIQFIRYSCELTKREIQVVMRRHKSAKQKVKYAEQKRQYRAQIEPAKQRACLDCRAERYKTMEPSKKRELSTEKAEKYKQFKEENREWYNVVRKEEAKKYTI